MKNYWINCINIFFLYICCRFQVWVAQSVLRTPVFSTCVAWTIRRHHDHCSPWHTPSPTRAICGNATPTLPTKASTAAIITGTAARACPRSNWCLQPPASRRPVSIFPDLLPVHYQTTTSRLESALFRTCR